MIQSKLFALFQTLSPAEKRRFKKWVHSPIHNNNAQIVALFVFLDTRTTFTDRSLKRERAFVFVYGNEPYDDLKMRRLMSEFLDVLEAFLAYEAWHNHHSEQWLALAKTYRQRQLTTEAGAYLQKAEQELDEQPLRDAQYFLMHYRLQEERLVQNLARDSALNLQEMADNLTRFFVLELLRNACSAASHAAIYRVDYQLPYLETVLEDCAAGRYDDSPLIRLYYHRYRCLQNPAAGEHFLAYKQLLPIAPQCLSRAELRDMLLVGINYCIRRLNTDESSFLREVFELYKFGLAEGTFLENGFLSRFSYKNIVAAALKLGETAWVEHFLETNSPLLAPEFRNHYERFCRAKLSYQNGDYDQVQTLLQDLTFDDVFLELDARVSLMKVYFETGKWRLLEGFLTSFERFVSRKKMLAYHAPTYRNIIQFTGKLMQWKSGKKKLSEEELRSLQHQISVTKPLSEREWLLKTI
ncbi:MAG: hypothetical protein IT261_08040 [Saprospiraceae bacterium]|nr:hypothetical protein [Saprospiraceae bacterium]